MEALKRILSDEDEVDLTPMIDVTFLLLIYFMVTTMLKQPEAELSSSLPGKSKSSAMNVKKPCLLYTSPSPRDRTRSRMPSSA